MTEAVSLVSLSSPSAETDCKTAEELIAYVARVSAKENQGNKSTAQSLINFLITHNHWSPLEMVNMTLEINTTRDIARQLLRHRSFSFQEFSQRYAEVNTDDFVLREARLQDSKNRQNSMKSHDMGLQTEWNKKQQSVIRAATEAYEWAAAHNIAKEQRRVVLPEGLTPSRMYMQGNIRSWLHYCLLRMGNGTQLEHIMIANRVWLILHQHFPNITKIFHEHQREIQNILLAYDNEQEAYQNAK